MHCGPIMLAVAAAFGALYGCRLGMDERTRSPHERALCLDKPGRCSGEAGLFVLAGSSPDLPSDDLGGAASTLADADVVGLGEAAHGSAGFIGIKVRLSRYLVEHYGFRVIAFESNRVATRRLDAYVQTCKGDPTVALSSLHKYWVDVQTRDLVQWLCQWNHQHPSDRVHVYGYDVQAPAEDRAELKALLAAFYDGRASVSAHDRRRWLPAARHLASLTTCEEGRREMCARALDAMDAALRQEQANPSERELGARLAAARIALTGYATSQRVAMIGNESRAFEARAKGMSSVFLQLRDLYFPQQKTVMWAHNIHVVKQHEDVKWSWVGAPIVTQGTLLNRTLGDKYRAVAVIGYEVWLDRPRQRGRADPRPASDSLEATLHELGWPGLLLDLRHPNAVSVVPLTWPFELGAPGVEILIPAKHYDALLFVDRSPMAHLLE